MGHPVNLSELVIDCSSKTWRVSSLSDQSLIGPVQYGWDRFKKDKNSMSFGGGLLAGSPLPGTRRMIVCGYSHSWEGFYCSALGGAMYVFHRLGVNSLWLRGKCETDIILVIRFQEGQYTVQFDPVETDPIWQGYVDAEGKTWNGFYALEHHIFDKYKSMFLGDQFRILTVGPAARRTADGAIGSSQVKKGELSQIDDWAGRGGLGSTMLQQHRVVGIIFGGDWQDPALKEAKELDEYFLKHFGQRAISSDLALSQKYRYVPKFETGGTFGVNMFEADDRLLSFNYQSIYSGDDERLAQHQNFIIDHYLKQFNEEIIIPRKFDHCGEPCAVACKKFIGEHKKDYEPYAVFGPNAGVFDQRDAERLTRVADTMGFDAIQIGGMVDWLMEVFAREIIPAEEFGLPAEKPRFKFACNSEQFDPIIDSAYNANYALAIMQMILFSQAGEPFRSGMRFAAKWMDNKYGVHTLDLAVFISHGSRGMMVPNQYWVPGVLSPMPLMGKYFQYYGNDFIPPYELGKKNVERFVYELYSENSGSCRFHRKWVEDIIDDIILSHFDLKMDYWQQNFNLAREIHDYQSQMSSPWESDRTIDFVQGYLEKWQRAGLKIEHLDEWVARFQQDKQKAAREFWQALYDGMSDVFQEGLNEPPHIDHGPISK